MHQFGAYAFGNEAALTVTGGGAPPTWAPTDLTGLIGWWKADAGVYKDTGSTLAGNGETVEQWNDQSGSNHHITQVTSAQRPTYGTASFNSSYKGLTFSAATKQCLWNAAFSINSSTISYFILLSGTTNAASGGRFLSLQGVGVTEAADWSNATSMAGGLSGGATATLYFYGNNAYCGASGAFAYTIGSPQLVGLVFNGASTHAYLGSSSQGTTNTTGATLGGVGSSHFGIGNANYAANVGTALFDGVIAEIIMTTGVMSPTDISSLVTYLNGRWGTAF